MVSNKRRKTFHVEWKNTSQKIAWTALDKHDLTFLIGPAGTAKTFLSVAFGITEILAKRRRKLVITRPVVEAGESLGFLPGTFHDKVSPYLLPLYDAVEKCVGIDGIEREKIDRTLEVAPLAYLRGRTFESAVCILDEAQNASYTQLKLFLTRMGEGTKMIVTGDPKQSDLRGEVALLSVVKKLKPERDVGIVEFNESSIVRHPLVGRILTRLE